MIRRWWHRWRNRRALTGEWCEACALADLAKPPRLLRTGELHAVVDTFTDDQHLAGGDVHGAATGAAVYFCAAHCPGGCRQGCVPSGRAAPAGETG